jgi:hypothetical protein
MAAKRLNDFAIVFYLLLRLPHFSEINSLVRAFIGFTHFLVSVLGFSIEGLLLSLTETVGERGRFAWGACLALWDLFVFFAVLTSRVSSSSLWMLSFFLRFFINSGALSALSSDPCGCLTCKTLVAKVH